VPTIIDYGMGNIGSIKNMFLKLGAGQVTVTSNPEEILGSDKIVLPGVGNFKKGVDNIDKLNLRSALNCAVLEKRVPVLGICLGMQLMALGSEEGPGNGLGWFDARVVPLSDSINTNLKIPHMGWNIIKLKRYSKLFDGLKVGARFYHVHAYHLLSEDPSDVVCHTHYGIDIVTGIEKENIFGVQFHPEKSHMFGMILLKNFLSL